jgi:hypothetical protein
MNAENTVIDFGVCRLALVAVRVVPNADSKQVNQLLFGDHYEVLQKTDDNEWMFIKVHFDSSEGWITKEQHHSITREYFEQINNANFKITTDLTSSILYKKSPITILMGSIVPISNSELFKLEEQFAFNGEAKSLGQKREFEFLNNIALKYLNAPELPGGKSPFGIDAAGFVQMVYKISGYSMPLGIAQQAGEGKIVKSLGEALPGDVAFFTKMDDKITHAGILLNDDKIIHVDGKVRIDHLMEEGILRGDTKIFTHSLKEIRRVLAV